MSVASVQLIKFRMNRSRAGIGGVALSKPVKNAVRAVAEGKAKPHAVSISPDVTGAYKGSWSVDEVVVRGITKKWPMDRVAANLVNNDPAATVIEVGYAKVTDGRVVSVSGHRVAGKTLEHLDATSDFRRPRGGRRLRPL